MCVCVCLNPFNPGSASLLLSPSCWKMSFAKSEKLDIRNLDISSDTLTLKIEKDYLDLEPSLYLI